MMSPGAACHYLMTWFRPVFTEFLLTQKLDRKNLYIGQINIIEAPINLKEVNYANI
jgi:hypothetical protein